MEKQEMIELFKDLKELVIEYAPDDDDDEDVVDTFNDIVISDPKDETVIRSKVLMAAHFVGDWYPDEEDDEVKEEIDEILEKADSLR